MEITELEVTTLDAALFDVPPGMSDAGNLQALTRAVSDANETKLAQQLTTPAAPPAPTTPGAALVGVPEVVNRTTQQIDTRALRGRLVSELAEAKLNAAPLAGSQADIAQVAGSHGYDYVLVAEITDLKVSKLFGMLPASTSGTSEGRTAADNQTVRNVFVIGPDKKVKLVLVYPMTTGRNFDEVLRVIDSLQLTAKHKVATPAQWKQGEDVIIAGSVSDDEAKTKYPEGWKAPRPWLRIVPQPR